MFKNKYIKQLQGVQAQIKSCKASIRQLEPPSPSKFKMGHHLVYWLEALFVGYNPNIDEVFKLEFNGLEKETCDYLRELGEYFINISEYHNAKLKYDVELVKLQAEEHCLKTKLGIN